MKQPTTIKHRLLKILAITVSIIVISIGGFVTYIKTALPNVGDAPELTIIATPEQVERGRYLANNVMLCMECHSDRDWSVFGAPIIDGTHGKGGTIFNQKHGFPGTFISTNITPSGLGQWTDGEIFRAITTGVSKDGHPLFPIMPYNNYGKLDSNDIVSVIAYLRTVAPVAHRPATSKSDFPVNIVIHTLPEKANFTTLPSRDHKVKYGEYLVTAANCFACHTKVENSKFTGQPFAGGHEFQMGELTIRSANLTPHVTGIGEWSEEMFIQRFKMYSDSTYKPSTPDVIGYQTVMPWLYFSHMTNEDLASIYAYLRSLPPADHTVVKVTNTKEEAAAKEKTEAKDKSKSNDVGDAEI